MERLHDTRRGILLLLFAIALFSAMDAVAKALVATYPAPQVVWVRFLGQLLAVMVILRHRLAPALRTAHPVLHLWRSAFQFGATTFFFLSLAHIGLAEATAIADINPVLITLGAALFLGERLTPARVIGLLASALGALVVIRPGSEVFTPAALLPLLCALSFAGNALLTRVVGQRESPWSSMVYGALFGTIVSSLALPWVWVPVEAADLPGFAVMALLGTAAQLALIRAYSVAEAAAIAPFSYAGIVFAAGYGLIFFAEVPDLTTVAGILVIVGAGLYVWAAERPRGRR